MTNNEIWGLVLLRAGIIVEDGHTPGSGDSGRCPLGAQASEMRQQVGGNEAETLDGKGPETEREEARDKDDFQVFPYDVLCKTPALLLKETGCKEHPVSPLHPRS